MSFCSRNEQETSCIIKIPKKIPHNKLIVPCTNFLMSKLEQMSLDTYSGRIIIESKYRPDLFDQIIKIGKVISIHKWRKTEELDITHNYATDETIRFLSHTLIRHFAGLQRFSYKVSWYSTLTNQGVESFGSALARHLSQLRQLDVQFRP